MDVVLRLTGEQHALLKAHLYTGDGNEAAAVILCGRCAGESRHCLTARQIIPVPYNQCSTRTPVRVTWSTDVLLPHLSEAAKRGLAVVKIHSHPGGLEKFSEWDDASDHDLFASVYGWMDNEYPHASAIMLPDGRIFGRVVTLAGEFEPLSMVSIVGDDLHFWLPLEKIAHVREFARRHAQAFGAGTAAILSRLTVAVIGASGTGSPIIEQLARLGVRKLILVDPDRVEEKNLNRILNATMGDARNGVFKVEMLARAIRRMGLGTEVVTFARNLFDPELVRAVAQADIVIGCMDSIDGRFLLNKLATFYVLPYFDVGIKLEADGHGGVEQICGTVHYLQPGRSSLLSRRMFTLEQVRAAGLRRTDPAAYKEQLRSKYIVGAQEDRPAVISVNMLFAAMAVNELLARLHTYRDDGNADFAEYGLSLTQVQFYNESEGQPCRILARHLGRGDVRPLLEMAELSDGSTEKAA
jgi:ThiF family/Prokaryotic homologs of the JAB domain